MKTKYITLALAMLAICLITLPAVSVAAAAAPADTEAVAPETPADGAAGIVAMLTPVVGFVVTFILKKTDQFPGWVLVAIPGITAGVFTYLTSLLGASDLPIWQGVLLGFVANVVHQLGKQMGKSIDENAPTIQSRI